MHAVCVCSFILAQFFQAICFYEAKASVTNTFVFFSVEENGSLLNLFEKDPRKIHTVPALAAAALSAT